MVPAAGESPAFLMESKMRSIKNLFQNAWNTVANIVQIETVETKPEDFGMTKKATIVERDGRFALMMGNQIIDTYARARDARRGARRRGLVLA